MKVRFVIGALVVALTPVFAVAPPASAATVSKTLTFDEIPATPADGLHTAGIKFGFTIAGAHSNSATYGGTGPGITKYVSDPSLTGPATGQLTLTFDRPTKLIRFGVALDTPATLSPGFTVKLFDRNAASLGTFKVDTSPNAGAGFSEAQFTKKGLAIKKAVVTFARARTDSFAFDNLTYKVAA
jgi:hypothetical protein